MTYFNVGPIKELHISVTNNIKNKEHIELAKKGRYTGEFIMFLSPKIANELSEFLANNNQMKHFNSTLYKWGQKKIGN